MDIFTTVLTKVVPVTIKPDSLKVKPLFKEPSIKELSDDSNRLENHDRYYLEKDKKDQHSSKEEHPDDNDKCEQGIKASEDVITHKDEILHPKEVNKNKDDDQTHLDIFV